MGNGPKKKKKTKIKSKVKQEWLRPIPRLLLAVYEIIVKFDKIDNFVKIVNIKDL